jgi:hypothetical protein
MVFMKFLSGVGWADTLHEEKGEVGLEGREPTLA